jgi:hypothetical protein
MVSSRDTVLARPKDRRQTVRYGSDTAPPRRIDDAKRDNIMSRSGKPTTGQTKTKITYDNS